MKKFAKKGVLLFVAVMAVYAFAMPSMASAASWGAVGSHHTLTSSNFGLVVHANGMILSCNNSSFTSTITGPGNLSITTGTFGGLCTSSIPGSTIDCTTTLKGTRFPWRATARSQTIIDIHDIHIDWFFEDMPGRAGSCSPLAGISTTLAGTLTGGHWTGNGANQHEVLWTAGPGLVLNTASSVTVSGTFRDAQQTLIVTG